MSARVEIVDAVIRDASFVMANMRPRDRREVMCQIPEGTKMHEAAYGLVMASDAWVAKLDGQPVAVFGTTPLTVCARMVWALGTKRMRKVVPAITRKLRDEHIPELVAGGLVLLEARSLEDHHEAHRWMEGTGARPVTAPFEFGKGRERFVIFHWSLDDYKRANCC